ncbi:unnamed protein product [Timema podura]|uniref:VWFC domain-containing protein n=1 Tax=Timema podura TaxID=61482 RepID=A0ABN7NUW0_TIMPD|nr:unnamed protein product [Timema podura]
MWRSNPALAGALLLLLLLLSPAAEAKRVPRRRPRPQAQQPETPGAGADDFNYEEGYDEYPDYYEELEFVGANTVTFKSVYAQYTGNLLSTSINTTPHHITSRREGDITVDQTADDGEIEVRISVGVSAHDRAMPTERPPSVGEDSSNLRGQRVTCGQHNEPSCRKTSTSTSTTTTTTTTTPPPPPPPPIEVQPIGQVAPVDVPETTLPPEPVEPSPQPPSRTVNPPEPDSRVGPDRKEPFSCTFEGRQYANLEEWEPDACTSCQCLRGQVECSQQQPCSSGRDTQFAT